MNRAQRAFAAGKAAASRAGGFLKGGIKGSAIAAGTGVATAIVGEMAVEKVQTLKDHWWAAPAALIVGGHVVKKKQYDAGSAMIGAGAFWGYLAYKTTQNPQQQTTTQTTQGDAGRVIGSVRGLFAPARTAAAGVPSAGALPNAGRVVGSVSGRPGRVVAR